MRRFSLAIVLLCCVCQAFGFDKAREFDFGFVASRLADPDGNMRL